MRSADRKFRVPRKWSNGELRKFAHLFRGSVVNVSGWRDLDKEGNKYRSYFVNADDYWITNYKSEARGYQGDQENEIYLDLEEPLSGRWRRRFDVVFNHTVMEHVFEMDVAFRNLCLLSKDIVILVVPFMQEQHGTYGDFWRFSPQAVDRLFRKNDFGTIYLNCNDSSEASIYVFAIASRNPSNWGSIESSAENKRDSIERYNVGTKLIGSSLRRRISSWVRQSRGE